MDAEDSPRCRPRLIVRPLIDKVIRSAGGELFHAVVEARWVHGVHFHIGRRKAQHGVGRVRIRSDLTLLIYLNRQFRAINVITSQFISNAIH